METAMVSQHLTMKMCILRQFKGPMKDVGGGESSVGVESNMQEWNFRPCHAENIIVMENKEENFTAYSYTLYRICDALKKGGVVAVPTDTVYGLISLPKYSQRLHEIKRRDAQKPLGLFVNDTKKIEKYAQVTVPPALLREMYPGAVTLLFERKSSSLPDTFNPGVSSVGFRIPQNRIVSDVCAHFPLEPIVQTSANVSGASASPLTIQDFEELHGQISLIVNTGEITQGRGSREGSTVVDLSVQGHYRIVRDGCALESTLKALHKFRLLPVASTTNDCIDQYDVKLSINGSCETQKQVDA